MWFFTTPIEQIKNEAQLPPFFSLQDLVDEAELECFFGTHVPIFEEARFQFLE